MNKSKSSNDFTDYSKIASIMNKSNVSNEIIENYSKIASYVNKSKLNSYKLLKELSLILTYLIKKVEIRHGNSINEILTSLLIVSNPHFVKNLM